MYPPIESSKQRSAVSVIVIVAFVRSDEVFSELREKRQDSEVLDILGEGLQPPKNQGLQDFEAFMI
jgi:hypothetical protein